MRRLLGAIGIVAALFLVSASSAFAGQEIGDRCVADDSEADWTALVLNNSLGYGELPPIVPPEGAKVITRWTVRAEPGTPPTQQQLVAAKQVGEEADVLVGESAIETVVAGSNEFVTRIPVPEYAHIGLRGPAATLFCDKLDGHLGGIVEGPWAIGEQRQFKVASTFGVPVTAIVETDRDADGFGDETQDGCPAVAALQTACPRILLSSSATVTRRAILLKVGTGDPARVEVTGQVGWTVRPKQGGPKKAVAVGLAGGAFETAKDTPSTLRVPLPRRVSNRLAKLPRGKTLKARFSISVTNVAGARVAAQRIVMLRGRAQPPR